MLRGQAGVEAPAPPQGCGLSALIYLLSGRLGSSYWVGFPVFPPHPSSSLALFNTQLWKT